MERSGMKQITRKAYAKINLGLDVLGRRENGYHDVRMIMQTVGIYDELTFTIREDAEIRIVIRQCSGQAQELPCDEHNLIFRAAKLVMEACHLSQGVTVELKKQIPIAAGMAGGSTDAAATILGLNELFKLHMKPDQMRKLAVQIGADVPYCLMGGTALAEGIGEILTAASPAPQCHLLVVKPQISVSTAFVYGKLDAEGLTWHPDIDRLMTCIRNGDVSGMAQAMGNVLETVTIPQHTIIRELKEEMKSLGASGALMSGSGPTVFGIFDTHRQLQNAYEKLRTREGVSQIFMTRFVADIEAAG